MLEFQYYTNLMQNLLQVVPPDNNLDHKVSLIIHMLRRQDINFDMQDYRPNSW